MTRFFLLILLLITACATRTPRVRMPNPKERLLPPKNVLVRHPFADDLVDAGEIEAPLRELDIMRGHPSPPQPGPPGPPLPRRRRSRSSIGTCHPTRRRACAF